MRAIDFRLRPPYKSYLKNWVMYNYDALKRQHQLRGIEPISEAAVQKSMDLLIQEMDQAGVLYGVTPVRTTTEGDNDDAVQIMLDYPNRFLGVPQADPLNMEEAFAVLDKYIIDGPCKAVIIEPGMISNPVKWFVNDEKIFPFYEKCVQNNIPVMISYGGRDADVRYYRPEYLFDVCSTFPELKIAVCHGGYPHTNQMIVLAMQFANLYLSPDSWAMTFAPMSEDYISAANYVLQNQVTFGTSYPAMRLPLAVENYTKRLRPEVVDKVLYANGAAFFGLEESQK